jgi:hypothetical protein
MSYRITYLIIGFTNKCVKESLWKTEPKEGAKYRINLKLIFAAFPGNFLDSQILASKSFGREEAPQATLMQITRPLTRFLLKLQ